MDKKDRKKRLPGITLYVFSRMTLMMLLLLLLYYLLLTELLHREETVPVDMALLASLLAFVVAVTVIRAKMIERKLDRVAYYLERVENPDRLEADTRFMTKEFDLIWQNLRRVLGKARKREEDKQKYNTKLKLKNRQRSDMLSAIAHEFRNPISSIMGYAQTLQEDPHISRELEEKFLQKIYNNGQKIEDLLSRLILWNKFESGEAKYHMSRFDLYSLAVETVQQLEEKYKKRAIVVEGESSPVDADYTLIEIVLKNLIENALKYSSDTVLVGVEKGVVTVTDSGVGIRRKDIAKVTKKFYRSGMHNWDNSMGLGLSIVKNILSLHHSTLRIESEEGVGSSFSFALK